jgi:putative restriction endonuclease
MLEYTTQDELFFPPWQHIPTAFDGFMIGVTPDYEIHVREDLLAEEDGPMLVHGLQELHGQKILLPSRQVEWPSRDALDWRFQRFVQQ